MRSNFSFLAEHSPLLADLGATAEKLYPFDPASCVLKLRLLAETLTQEVASRIGLRLIQPTQAELLRAVDQRLGLDAQVRQMFHLLRQRGNEAAHQVDHRIGYREGMEALKVAREVALWFHRSFGAAPDFKPGPFVLPDDPSQRLADLQQQVAALQDHLQQAQTAQASQTELAQLLEAQAAQERALAARAAEEREVYESLAEEASARYAALKADFPNDSPTYLATHLTTYGRMFAGSVQIAERKAAQGRAKAYFYLLEWETPVGPFKSPHTLEIPLVFDNVETSRPLLGPGPAPQVMAKQMSAAWLAFARTGDPNTPVLPNWPAYEPGRRATMIFNQTSRVVDDPYAATRKAVT